MFNKRVNQNYSNSKKLGGKSYYLAVTFIYATSKMLLIECGLGKKTPNTINYNFTFVNLWKDIPNVYQSKILSEII